MHFCVNSRYLLWVYGPVSPTLAILQASRGSRWPQVLSQRQPRHLQTRILHSPTTSGWRGHQRPPRSSPQRDHGRYLQTRSRSRQACFAQWSVFKLPAAYRLTHKHHVTTALWNDQSVGVERSYELVLALSDLLHVSIARGERAGVQRLEHSTAHRPEHVRWFDLPAYQRAARVTAVVNTAEAASLARVNCS